MFCVTDHDRHNRPHYAHVCRIVTTVIQLMASYKSNKLFGNISILEKGSAWEDQNMDSTITLAGLGLARAMPTLARSRPLLRNDLAKHNPKSLF